MLTGAGVTYSPSHMVARGLSDPTPGATGVNILRQSTGKALGSWSPRGDRARAQAFRIELSEALRRAAVPSWVLEGPPTPEQVAQKYPKATVEERGKEYQAALAEYQAHNTSVWDVLEPALDHWSILISLAVRQ